MRNIIVDENHPFSKTINFTIPYNKCQNSRWIGIQTL
jgi:hypothetical protein